MINTKCYNLNSTKPYKTINWLCCMLYFVTNCSFFFQFVFLFTCWHTDHIWVIKKFTRSWTFVPYKNMVAICVRLTNIQFVCLLLVDDTRHTIFYAAVVASAWKSSKHLSSIRPHNNIIFEQSLKKCEVDGGIPEYMGKMIVDKFITQMCSLFLSSLNINCHCFNHRSGWTVRPLIYWK